VVLDRRSRWHIETPSIIQGSVLVMSKTGVGLAMFSMGTELIATASYIRTQYNNTESTY